MQTGESEKALIYIELLRKTLKQEQQQEATMDMQFQMMQMQSQGQPMGGAPPPQAPNSLGAEGGAVSSAAQGFSPTGPPNAPPVGAPGAPGPRTNIDQRLADLGITRTQ